MTLRALSILLVVGCGRARPVPPPPSDAAATLEARTDAAPLPVRARRPLAVGPAPWAGEGVRVDLPEGWIAWPGEGGATVRFRHASGAEVRVVPEAVLPSRDDCAWRFDDEVGRARDVPLVRPARLAHCVPHDADGRLTRAWVSTGEDAAWRVELILPPGTAIAASDAAAPLLGSLVADRRSGPPTDGGGAGPRGGAGAPG